MPSSAMAVGYGWSRILNAPEPPPPRGSAAAGKENKCVRMTVFKGFPGPLVACALPSTEELALAMPGLENFCFRIEAVLRQDSY